MFFNWSHGLVPWELVSDHVLPCYTLENEIDMFGACDTFGAGFLIGSITQSHRSSLAIASCPSLRWKARFTCFVCVTSLELAMFSDWPHGLVPWELVSDRVLPCYVSENKTDMFACATLLQLGMFSDWPNPLGARQ